MDRRSLLQQIAAVASAALWSGETLAVEMAKAAAARDAGDSKVKPKRLSAPRMATLSALTNLIIPATDTPGAVQAGVPVFVGDMYLHWMTQVEREAFDEGLDALDRDSRARFGKTFSKCKLDQQADVFGATRAAIKDYKLGGLMGRIADVNAPFFYKARDLTTLGYFTSELGVSKELAYVPVPGRFEGDVDIKTWNKQMPS